MQIEITTDLTSPIYQDSLAIRRAVFVQEQGVPENLEVDEDEAHAIYFVGYLDHQAVATARLLPDADGFHVQRVAVAKAFRKQHLGQALLAAMTDYARQQQAHHLSLNAQVSAVGFYQRLGYTLTAKPEFLDAGIKHRQMRRDL
ncbi:GNAT family N-acetyltransferase [Lacticaseibacillus brantae]|uniref:GNAT family acetyltransferase n=1 Tax=Lacticaseibacillus brantae DSM 23927 TaxID=1423727 RepID=A0A0R2AYP0_9LACO|nr:GNAT family N-acetyltransferase [Lacticaseibacillus brantae]KRM72449.1 GNAT family acetyltransferase [Lacticaseibacillus brantae DSM 23927]